MILKCDAVFEGGGVRGIGHVGAAYIIEKAGYEFQNLAGSSAGAIVAALIAVGYTTDEIKKEMETIDYLQFRKNTFLSNLGFLGKAINLYKNFGIYDPDYFEEWLTGMLLKKGKLTFGDIKINDPSAKKYTYKLQVTASDITDQKLLMLPWDLEDFGIDPDSYSIAKAVRMSMSIPVFYVPFRLTDTEGREHLIVDGGLLSNYPIWILDDGTSNPPYPTFGFKFIEDDEKYCINCNCCDKKNVFEYVKSIATTALDAHDNYHISNSKGDFERTIGIPVTVNVNGIPKKIASTDFAIDKTESLILFNNGMNSAVKFLDKWDFNKWKKIYRGYKG